MSEAYRQTALALAQRLELLEVCLVENAADLIDDHDEFDEFVDDGALREALRKVVAEAAPEKSCGH